MWYITINNNYLPNGVKVKSGSLSIDFTENGQRSVLSFDLIDENLTGTPYLLTLEPGMKVELYNDGVLIFGGRIDDPEILKINVKPVLSMSISCIDWNYLLEKNYVNQSYPKMLISDVFKDIIDNFLSSDGVNYDSLSIKETTNQYISINCPYILAKDVFNEMAELINWQWRIGPDKKIYLNEYANTWVEQFEEGKSKYLEQSLKFRKDMSNYYNTQILKDVIALTDLITEKATPTPDSDKSFFVRFPLNDKPELYVTSNISDPQPEELIDPREIGISGEDSGLTFYYTKGSNIIQQDDETIEIPEEMYLVVRYVGQYVIDVIEADSSQIAERIAIEGGNGIYINIESGNEIEGIVIAENKANAMLEKFARISKEITFESFDIDIDVGDILNVKIPSLNIDTTLDSNQFYLITEKIVNDIGTYLKKQYTLIDGIPFTSWIRNFSNFIKGGKDWTIREDAKVDLTISESEQYDWSGTVTIKLLDCLYPESDPGGLYPESDPGGLYPGTLTNTIVETD